MQGVKIMSMAKKLSSESSRCKLHHKIRHGLLACDEILGMWYSKWSTLYGEVFYNSLSWEIWLSVKTMDVLELWILLTSCQGEICWVW